MGGQTASECGCIGAESFWGPLRRAMGEQSGKSPLELAKQQQPSKNNLQKGSGCIKPCGRPIRYRGAPGPFALPHSPAHPLHAARPLAPPMIVPTREESQLFSQQPPRAHRPLICMATPPRALKGASGRYFRSAEHTGAKVRFQVLFFPSLCAKK